MERIVKIIPRVHAHPFPWRKPTPVASQIRLKKRNTPPMTSPTVLANAPTAGRAESRAEKAIIAKLIKSPKTPIRI